MPRELGPVLYFDQASVDRIPKDIAGHMFYFLLFPVTSELIATSLLIYLEAKSVRKKKLCLHCTVSSGLGAKIYVCNRNSKCFLCSNNLTPFLF